MTYGSRPMSSRADRFVQKVFRRPQAAQDAAEQAAPAKGAMDTLDRRRKRVLKTRRGL